MAEDSQSPSNSMGGITRREALRRGALLGGALAWATPIVQVVGMKPALAQTVSPACRLEIRVVDPIIGAVTLCLEGPPEFCDCINNADTPDDLEQCLEDFLSSLSITPGPCS